MKKLIAITVLLIFSSCGKKSSQGDNPEDQDWSKAPTASRADDSVVPVSINIEPDRLVINTEEPDDSSLTCKIDDHKPFTCRNGMFINIPDEGEHTLVVTALRDGNIVGLGEVRFTIPSDDPENERSANYLKLEFTDNKLVNDMQIEEGSDFELAYDLIAKDSADSCENYRVSCSYDSKSNEFQIDCNKNTSHTIPSELLALGLQEIKLQASCGDQVGPELSLTFTVVPENYKKLQLVDFSDSNDKRAFPLVIAEDCSAAALKYECRNSTGSFATCTQESLMSNNSQFTEIRAVCGSDVGPELKLN